MCRNCYMRHSVRVKQLWLADEPEKVKALTIRERPGKNTFRFWQEGSGYDRNLLHGKTLAAAIDYIHMNPNRRGLCETLDEWPWSSWHWYERREQRPGLPTVHGPPEMELV